MDPDAPQNYQPSTPPPIQQAPTQQISSGISFRHTISVCFALIIVLGLIAGAYYLGTQKNAKESDTKTAIQSLSPTILPTKKNPSITSLISPTPQISSGWKLYTSQKVKASFNYPPDWTITKSAQQSNYPATEVDQIGLQSPHGTVTVSWVSALDGFGGACDPNASLAQGCPLITVLEKLPIKNAPGLYVISGTITQDGTIYQPFLAVQDSNGLVTTRRSMAYDMFIGKNNGGENRSATALFSTGAAYAKGPSLSQSNAEAWFNNPEVQQAKLILLSLSYY